MAISTLNGLLFAAIFLAIVALAFRTIEFHFQTSDSFARPEFRVDLSKLSFPIPRLGHSQIEVGKPEVELIEKEDDVDRLHHVPDRIVENNTKRPASGNKNAVLDLIPPSEIISSFDKNATRISTVSIKEERVDVYNACLQYGQIVAYTDHEEDLEGALGNNPSARNVRMHVKWVRKSAKDFSRDVTKAGGLLAKHDVLLFPENQKPAHCLHDFLFTAFLKDPDGMRFNYYIPLANPTKTCNPTSSWCCFLFYRAGVIDYEKAIPPSIRCFEHMTLILFGKGRYAPDWDKVPERVHTSVYSHESGQFPLPNLQNLHHKLLFFDDAVVSKRKPQLRPTRRINVLILDRSEANRRVWENSREFVSMLEAQWDQLSNEKLGGVSHFGAYWGQLTPLEQARQFYHADVIISPHGAQLSNLIFGESRRTFLVELTCLSSPFANQEAYRTLSWFGTFPNRLGMKVANFHAPNADCPHNVESFRTNNMDLLQFIKDLEIFTEELS